MNKWPEITKDTPVEEVMVIHKDIWDEIIYRFIHLKEFNKYSVLMHLKPQTPYTCNCALCEYSLEISDKTQKCGACLWHGARTGEVSCLDGLYTECWDTFKDFVRRPTFFKKLRVLILMRRVRNIRPKPPRKRSYYE